MSALLKCKSEFALTVRPLVGLKCNRKEKSFNIFRIWVLPFQLIALTLR